MKIGVIGLLPAQTASIQKLVEHPLEFLSREREREARDFASRMTLVILMTKFISHPTQNAVPAHKRVLISGGMTALRNYLKALAVPVEKKKKPATIKEPTMSTTETQVDYTKLTSLAVGETMDFHRPAKVPIIKWEKQVASVRSYYRRQHGLVTKAAFKDGIVTITLVDRALFSSEPTSADQVSPPVADQSEQMSSAAFWQQVVIARAGQAISIGDAIRDASEAVRALELIFRK